MENLLPALGHVVRQLQTQGRRDILTVEALLNRLTGDNNAGTLLRRLLYWFPKAKHPGGWVYKSANDWAAECAISEGTVKRIHNRRLLEAVGIQRQLKKANGAPTNHYRLDVPAFKQSLARFLNVPVETLQSWMAGTKSRAKTTESSGHNQPSNPDQTSESNQHNQPSNPEQSARSNGYNPPSPEQSARSNQHNQPSYPAQSAEYTPRRQSNTSSDHDQMDSAQSDHSTTKQYNTSFNNNRYIHKNNNNNTLSVVVVAEEEFHEDLPQVPDITPQTMKQLVREYSLNRARAVIAYANQQTNLRNRAGFIVARIRDGKLGLEHPDEVYTSRPEEDGKRFITGEYADFIKH